MMDILYQDPDLAAVVKPVGVDSEHDLPRMLEQTLGGGVYPIHRVDLNVGGVMVYARSSAAAAALSRLVQQGEFVKEYRALVHGVPPQGEMWQDLLFKDSRKNKVFVVKRERKGVKRASLEFTRLTQDDPALVHILLHTGALTRSGCSLHPGDTRWWGITSTAPGMKCKAPCSIPAGSVSRGKGGR